MNSFYGYARVSNDPKEGRGMSAKFQEDGIRKLYEARYGHLRWGGVAVDPNVSGKTPLACRAAGGRVCESLRAGDVFCVYKIDRAFRSLSDFVNVADDWVQNGVALVSCTEPVDLGSPIGRSIVQILAVFAELEREMIRQRQKAAFDQARREGRWMGDVSRSPPGLRYNPDTLLHEPVEHEREVASLLLQWYQLPRSFKEIAVFCEEKGVDYRGRRINGRMAMRMVANECKIRFFLKHKWPLYPIEFNQADGMRLKKYDRFELLSPAYVYYDWIRDGEPLIPELVGKYAGTPPTAFAPEAAIDWPNRRHGRGRVHGTNDTL